MERLLPQTYILKALFSVAVIWQRKIMKRSIMKRSSGFMLCLVFAAGCKA